MLLSYDTGADAKYLTLQPEKRHRGVVTRTKQIEEWLLVDYNKDGFIFGIEILNASLHPVSLSVVNQKEIRYSSASAEELTEGELVLVEGEAVAHNFA